MSNGYAYVSNAKAMSGGGGYSQPMSCTASMPYIGTNWVPTSMSSLKLMSGGRASLGAGAKHVGAGL